MQKAASKERKTALREQRNMIKAQLSTNSTITKIKRKTQAEKRQPGPLKVYSINSQSESVKSEASISKQSSGNEEIVSIISRTHSVVSCHTEELVPHSKNLRTIEKSTDPHMKAECVKK